ncbi:Stk1 family PASTA domain-containing Ser/Thr kinase [Mesobacillus foraminis]|uniref:Stk1 family PASTA domain-containing Ser/Thr kinase n=1 Tax=Mesobacillus foraminis TaxID=279826 RepID=UPI001BE61C72|nr:Stk1 family PASTA domain-containing Ser/Thr kinase [Mesobacillus foraminis]MBT2756061.1 Stk1 family PASTA domain-containing Ser/Thr kinase [Mesobacillus foraminis]
MIRGKRISGRYKILDMIGGGGMANVYLAHDMILDRDVAVKMLRLDFANDEEFIRRFHREAQSATSLAHPNIVSIYDVGEEDGLYYIVMEYVDGPTLKQYIQQNAPVPVEKTLDIMGQLTSAISNAHHNHIIHRDIKPQNILIDPEGNVKITDFGIAMALSATSITQTNSVLGSVHYLSPEQARGGMATNKSDIYSLGIVMFELLTGRLPFSGESAVSIALKHLQSETPSLKRWNPGIPQSVENIVLKATAKDPFHRYENVYAMEEDLRTSLNPDRLNEPKFTIPEDDEATKAIPIITDDRPYRNLDETIVHKEQAIEPGKADIKKQKKKPEKKSRKKWPLILSLIFAFLVIGIAGFMIFGPELFGPKEVTVPEVEGMELEEAVADLLSAGFVIGNQKEVSDQQIEEGSIIRSSPKAGRVVKEGTAIDLYISTGKAKVVLSDYRGRMYEEALRTLQDKNFKDVEAIEEHDDSEAGTILAQYPSGGEEVIPDETVVEFTVSKGPELIELIDLTDYNEKSVNDYATTNGLVIEKAEEFHESVEKGLVISQDPEPGTRLDQGSKVKVTISKGKELIPPKSVTEEIEILYDESLNGEPQKVQLYIDDVHYDMNEPADVFEIKETTMKKITLDIPYKGKAGYRIITNNQVVSEKEIPYSED